MKLIRKTGRDSQYHEIAVYRCPDCHGESVRRIDEVRRRKQSRCAECNRKHRAKPRREQYNRRWTSAEDAILWVDGVASGKTRHELEALLPGRSAKAIKDRQLALGIRQPPSRFKNRIVGCSCRPPEYAGPPGWTVSDGPPCLRCGFHEVKTIYGAAAGERSYFRRECQTCRARVAWDMANSGLPAPTDASDSALIYEDWAF